ncbi:hypothetical protein WJX72_001996 [[Myrmecia] bisecta]|uniref:Prolyl 4-hydroxylase alpha subunit Fe(2+) 2OG dioxygenase domain-containing protein n=1 Tax=[Myrmecia] bisecta TaxID=41462 RepID=A0AAW1Q2N4_9CHLO
MTFKVTSTHSVRKCWQLDLDKFVLLNGDWAKHLTTSRSGSVLESVRASLADTCPYIIAQPYKLLVHEKGSFFKAHTDTQRTPGMYGTLLVHLPSAHSGGEFVAAWTWTAVRPKQRHQGQERAYRSATSKPMADTCQHTALLTKF